MLSTKVPSWVWPTGCSLQTLAPSPTVSPGSSTGSSLQVTLYSSPSPAPTPAGKQTLLPPPPHPDGHCLCFGCHQMFCLNHCRNFPSCPTPSHPSHLSLWPVQLKYRADHIDTAVWSSMVLPPSPPVAYPNHMRSFLRKSMSRPHIPDIQIKQIQGGAQCTAAATPRLTMRGSQDLVLIFVHRVPSAWMPFPALPTRQTSNCFSKLFLDWDWEKPALNPPIHSPQLITPPLSYFTPWHMPVTVCVTLHSVNQLTCQSPSLTYTLGMQCIGFYMLIKPTLNHP